MTIFVNCVRKLLIVTMYPILVLIIQTYKLLRCHNVTSSSSSEPQAMPVVNCQPTGFPRTVPLN
jgi:hypothetical protein